MWYIVIASASFIAGYFMHKLIAFVKRLDRSYEKHARELEDIYHED